MDKFKELVTLCTHPVSINVNEHIGMGLSIRDYLEVTTSVLPSEQEILLMEQNNLMFEVIAYPRSNIAFYSYYSHDLDLAIEKVIEGVKYGSQKD